MEMIEVKGNYSMVFVLILLFGQELSNLLLNDFSIASEPKKGRFRTLEVLTIQENVTRAVWTNPK